MSSSYKGLTTSCCGLFSQPWLAVIHLYRHAACQLVEAWFWTWRTRSTHTHTRMQNPAAKFRAKLSGNAFTATVHFSRATKPSLGPCWLAGWSGHLGVVLGLVLTAAYPICLMIITIINVTVKRDCTVGIICELTFNLQILPVLRWKIIFIRRRYVPRLIPLILHLRCQTAWAWLVVLTAAAAACNTPPPGGRFPSLRWFLTSKSRDMIMSCSDIKDQYHAIFMDVLVKQFETQVNTF